MRSDFLPNADYLRGNDQSMTAPTQRKGRSVVIVGAGARGNRVFARLISQYATGFDVVGVVEPLDPRRDMFRQQYGIPESHSFATLDAFLSVPRFADIVFICTLDPTHYEICRSVSEHGYDVLLEKPIATSLPECLALLEVERECRNRILVAHVLRYSPFFQAIKEIIDSGRHGRVRHIHLEEQIGHWHYAHSYVRGSWRRVADCAPIILTKCSHDLDIIPWLMGEKVVNVASVGGRTYFQQSNAPAGATDRCVDCPHQRSCQYSATRFYLNDRQEWPYESIAQPADSMVARREAVATGPYGRCVWHCDNDVCEDQTVILEFESGVRATFEMHALTADSTRRVTVLLDNAEVRGDLYRNELTVTPHTGTPHDMAEQRIPLPDIRDRHGGGDLGLLQALHGYLSAGRHQEVMSSLSSSVLSHVLAFLADDSRRSNGVPLPVSDAFIPTQLMEHDGEE